MKKLLILSFLMLPSAVSASWYFGRQCGNGQDSGKPLCNSLFDDAQERLGNLEKLNNFYKEEDNLQEEEQNFITEEKIFIDQIKTTDPFTPYEEFTEGMGLHRFASDELLDFKKEHLYKKMINESYNESPIEIAQYLLHRRILEEDIKSIDRIKQLKELKNSYQNLQNQVNNYDQKLKTSKYITNTASYDGDTIQYLVKCKPRSQKHVIPMHDTLTELYQLFQFYCIQDENGGITKYKEVVDDIAREFEIQILALKNDEDFID